MSGSNSVGTTIGFVDGTVILSIVGTGPVIYNIGRDGDEKSSEMNITIAAITPKD